MMLGVNEGERVNFTGIKLMSMFQLQDIAETIFADALERAWPPTNRSTHNRSLEEQLQDPTFRQRVKVGLAKGLVELVAAHDEHVLSAYLFEGITDLYPQIETCSSPEIKTHLLILVSKRSAALYALVTALDEAFVREAQKLLPLLANQQESLLNPIFITEADVAQHKGYALLLSSAHVSPLTIWGRD